MARSRSTENRQYNNWDRARLSVVVPIGVIVAVAIVCIVVAVLSSAQRADEVAIAHDKQLFSSTVTNHGERILREIESVVASETAARNIRQEHDGAWVRNRVGRWLGRFFDHDFVFIVDGRDHLTSLLSPSWLADEFLYSSARDDMTLVLDYLRNRVASVPAAIGVGDGDQSETSVHRRIALVQNFLGQPAIVAATAIRTKDSFDFGSSADAPIVASVKLFDRSVLADVAARLRLANLRSLSDEPTPENDHTYDLTDPAGNLIARFAWTPKQPGAEIVNSVIPFIAVALAGFALLAAFVLRYMQKTAVAIAAGESRLRHLAMHDPLCGLPNRIFFGERLEAVIEEVHKGSAPAAVFYIDLDHFKDVNDTLGHPVGDELIRNVTLRLSRTLRGDDLVARLGGDEFAVISSIGDDQAKVMMVAQRIITAICAPYIINKQNIVIGASIGIAIVDKNVGDAADIMRYADMALYRAKNEGRNRACIYDAAMDADLSSRKLLENDLREAIEANALRVLYQPLVNKSGETVVGVEALCRWTHPVRGEVPPSEFIPVAEHSGMIIELGEYVLRRACLDGKSWPGLSVAVNVSPLQFRRTDFVSMVERVLAETDFDPSRLEIEVTESTLLGNVDSAEAAMMRLKGLGVQLALDDFGTGYSSLLYLRRFPFDKLKIDRSFVSSIEKAADAAAIVHAVVSLGRGLGMKVTAEGVETADQHLFLRAAGVHTMQGYRFGKAVTAAEISARLRMPAVEAPDDKFASVG